MLSFRLFWPVGLIFLLVTAVVVALIQQEWRSLRQTLADRTFAVTVRDIRSQVEDQLGFGMTLRELNDVQEQLDRHLTADTDILTLEIFDENGRSQYNTTRNLIGLKVPEEWMSWMKEGGRDIRLQIDPTVSGFDAGTLLVGGTLEDGMGDVVGGVLLRAKDPLNRADRRWFGSDFLTVPWLEISAISLLLWAVVWWRLQAYHRLTQAIETAAEDQVARRPREERIALVPRIRALSAAVGEESNRIAEARRRIEALDDEA